MTPRTCQHHDFGLGPATAARAWVYTQPRDDAPHASTPRPGTSHGPTRLGIYTTPRRRPARINTTASD
ncbi:Hypp1772 [Branchiostoma lanceolatum]|uniref:Hypp1772 protein n=1 Tax=Branchiostoma lanceolatum TaxID=7740 RepID=A0A8J9ZLT5_BRALA|nr:Hypp1772 [Branchiostoma lanceolatum]